MTMATILRTASFRLWQKLTRAAPLGPILPNMIPAGTQRPGCEGVSGFQTFTRLTCLLLVCLFWCFYTHGCWENNNSKDVHPITRSFPRSYKHVRGRSQVQGKVLDVTPIIASDAVDERPPCGGLGRRLTHTWLWFHNVLAAGPVLFTERMLMWRTLWWNSVFIITVWHLPAETWLGPD